MSMHLNASKSYQSTGSGFQNNDHQAHDHDGPSLSLHSSFGDLNHSNGSSGSSTTTANTNPHVGSRPIISSLSHLGLSKRVTEVRTSYVAPHRVHVHSFIDFMPVQNQKPDLPLTEVTVTHEIVRTQLLAATSTRDRIFNIPGSDDDEIRIQRQPSIQTQTALSVSSNQVNHSLSFQRPEPLRDHHFQKPCNNFAHFQTSINSRHDHPSLGSYLQNPGYNNPSHYQNSVPMETKDQNPSANPPLIIRKISSGELRFYLESNISNPLRSFNSVDTDISEDEDDEIEGDGRTHSLPYKKYGPYTCPKCKGVFDTSQSFAAHIGSHYKYETSEERRKRLAARRRRKNLRLFRFGAGLTVVPDYSLNTAWQRRTWNVHENAEMAVKSEERDDGDEEDDEDEEDIDGDHEMQKQAPPPEPEAAEAGLIGNEIKRELLELMV
ncbi:hypothetical protein F2P56_011746 [Juglans regia]|uniref:Uncharacterized protein LOC108994476 n=2 Tax=Juglans regia TaxID=51240 RepID=A0A2I4F0R9_JUGRE|nr:uncharacterized protein LOC108994476 [Juglans regia]KAF5471303.1 hypothetical protein F2P56_011746 [Juglans regia]